MPSTLTYKDTYIIWISSNLFAFRKHGPSWISESGTVLFSQLNDRSHASGRISGPAHIRPDGYVHFTNANSAINRTNGPAIIWPNSRKAYYINGIQMNIEEFFTTYGVL